MFQRILVTGGAGFIGHHLVKCLLRAGHKVFVLDNFVTGVEENIAPFKLSDRFEFIRHDVTQSLPNIKVDAIYNLACPASPPQYQKNPVETVKTNVAGAINVLELAKRHKARVLQASTSEIYGDPEMHPQKEEYWGHVNPVGRRACYDEGKRCAETLFFDYHREYSIDIRVIRVFNTFGPNMAADDGRVVTNFILQALQGSDISLYGDGMQTRSFMYVDDLIEGMIMCMETPEVYEPINVGNPQEVTIQDLAKAVLVLTQSQSRLVYHPLPENDPTRRKPDITRARELLGWQPRIDWQEGLAKTIAYWQQKFL